MKNMRKVEVYVVEMSCAWLKVVRSAAVFCPATVALILHSIAVLHRERKYDDVDTCTSMYIMLKPF